MASDLASINTTTTDEPGSPWTPDSPFVTPFSPFRPGGSGTAVLGRTSDVFRDVSRMSPSLAAAGPVAAVAGHEGATAAPRPPSHLAAQFAALPLPSGVAEAPGDPMLSLSATRGQEGLGHLLSLPSDFPNGCGEVATAEGVLGHSWASVGLVGGTDFGGRTGDAQVGPHPTPPYTWHPKPDTGHPTP
mmetsp:Transcript_25763/g.81771  ORF Transcript_25763/g.81771 Transcript_25763/m.81771 type:complete len:188 (-) Transcript_25763:143-706(-)